MDGASYGTNHPTSATYDTSFTVNNPTKTGHTFTGWKITNMDSVTHYYGSSTTTNTSINSTKETSYKNLRSTSGTVTFTAQWKANCLAGHTYNESTGKCEYDGTLSSYSCPNGGTASGSTCSYTASVESYTCSGSGSPNASGTCQYNATTKYKCYSNRPSVPTYTYQSVPCYSNGDGTYRPGSGTEVEGATSCPSQYPGY